MTPKFTIGRLIKPGEEDNSCYGMTLNLPSHEECVTVWAPTPALLDERVQALTGEPAGPEWAAARTKIAHYEAILHTIRDATHTSAVVLRGIAADGLEAAK